MRVLVSSHKVENRRIFGQSATLHLLTNCCKIKLVSSYSWNGSSKDLKCAEVKADSIKTEQASKDSRFHMTLIWQRTSDNV